MMAAAEDPKLEINRREHPRLVIQVAISLESNSQLYAGLTRDVSRGGVFVPTYQDIEVGTETDLELELPNGTIEARGVVRWQRVASDSSPPGIGIEFVELDDAARGLLDELCAEYEPLYYDVV
jgi:molecular chaperone DnaK